jgi:peptidoglycan/LPS O-acetylase OafA/YrhL
MPQLDALRFFAIMGVIVSHNWGPPRAPWIFGGVVWGELGVRLFFVLSGFLITGILIRGREITERAPERRLFVIRQFYIRRFLRIFPIYYVVLIGLVVIGVGPARAVWPWLFSYTTNIYIWHHVQWLGSLGHLWTLAVEEQFYLVWPWLVLFLPRKWLLPILLAIICLAPLYRLYASFHYGSDVTHGFASGTLTIAVLDSLGLGAVLALAAHAARGKTWFEPLLRRVVLPVGVLGFTVLLAISHYGVDSHVSVALDQTGEALIFCWLVGSAAIGFRGWFGRLLEWRPIAYLGKISYGIYIFHALVPVGFAAAATALGIEYRDHGVINFVSSALVTFAIAALSWELFESRVNSFKRYFPYRSERDLRPVPAVAAAGAVQPLEP